MTTYRPLIGPVLVSGDTASHAKYGVGPASDYAVGINTPVFAPLEGIISRYWSITGGWTVVVDGDGATFFGQHNNGFEGPGPGQYAAARQQIARSGNTGSATTGPHLHGFIVLDNGDRLSVEEYVAAMGGTLTPIWHTTPPGIAPAGGGVTPFPEPTPKRKRASMTTLYQDTSTFDSGGNRTKDTVLAYAGDYPGSPEANWQESTPGDKFGTAADIYVQASISGVPIIPLDSVSFAAARAMYQMPLTVNGGSSSGGGDNSEVVKALQAVAALLRELPAEMDRYADGKKQSV